MKLLTYIDRKVKDGHPLDRDDLIFLYEIEQQIEGFGYQKDPRIAEIRESRDNNADACTVFNCDQTQIANSADEITDQTIVFIGPLTPGIFEKLQTYGIEYTYTNFPEGSIEKIDLEIGGKSKDQLITELKSKGVKISNYASEMLSSPDFTTTKTPQNIILFKLRVGDLGLNSPTTDQLYAKALDLGLDLCPAEVGPHLRLQNVNQPINDWYRIAMQQITDRDGRPVVFNLVRKDNGLLLDDAWTSPTNKWFPVYRFVFRLRELPS